MAGRGQSAPGLYRDTIKIAYVPGAGRGAVGFTTRSDVGPALPAAAVEVGQTGKAPGIAAAAPAGYRAGAGRGATGMGEHGSAALLGAVAGAGIKAAASSGPIEQSESFDEFSGFSGKLFNTGHYDAEDEEADDIYDAIDARMDERRKRFREAREKEERIKMRLEKPRITDMFADLKSKLNSVSDSEWNAIPDATSQARNRKNRRLEAANLPVPDFVYDAARTDNKMASSISGYDTPAGAGGGGGGGASGASTDIRGLHASRNSVLMGELKKMSDSVTGQTVVDPKGMAMDLESRKDLSTAEISDLKKARLLTTSMYKTNPKHGPAWIAGARVEEQAQKLTQARKIIRQGCEACPEDEDVWLEAVRLATHSQVQSTLASAIRQLPRSVKLWMMSAEKEPDVDTRRKIYRRALEIIPNSVRIWKTAVELEDPEDARVMLQRAVQCVPQSVDLWLALARLQTYKAARDTLNRARKAVPANPDIWITAAKLEEAQGNAGNIDKIVTRALKSLAEVHIDRETWIKIAEDAEKAGAPLTCASVIKATIGLGVDNEDRKRTWLADAESLTRHGSIAASRAVYAHTLSVFPKKAAIWKQAASLEKTHGTPELLDAMLKEAVTHCPSDESLWLMAAKEKWTAGNIPAARGVLTEAFKANRGSEEILLAGAKLEWETGEYERARTLLGRARESAPSERVFMKSVLLEREVGNTKAESSLLSEALRKYPAFDKLWMMAGQLAERQSAPDRARDLYKVGLRHCPASVPLWQLAAKLAESTEGIIKARSLLEMARIKNPKNPKLWVETIRLENRAGNDKVAANLMAKALQEVPTSGLLWAENIRQAPKDKKRRIALDGIGKTDYDPNVMLETGKHVLKSGKVDRARNWMTRAAGVDPDLGDTWVELYKLEVKVGGVDSDAAKLVLQRCNEANPRHGEIWTAVSKQMENRRRPASEVCQIAAGVPVPARPHTAGGAGVAAGPAPPVTVEKGDAAGAGAGAGAGK